jgi:hypothetical protein
VASLDVVGDELVLHLGPWERVGGLQRADLRVALRKITDARSVDNAYAEVRGLRVPGTGVPGVLLLGTWRKRGLKQFVAVRGRGPGCVIDLAGERFDRWVVSGPLPDGL